MGPPIWFIFRDDSKIDFLVVFIVIKKFPPNYQKVPMVFTLKKFNFSMGSHSFQIVSQNVPNNKTRNIKKYLWKVQFSATLGNAHIY
jgi:hypothetical protein